MEQPQVERDESEKHVHDHLHGSLTTTEDPTFSA